MDDYSKQSEERFQYWKGRIKSGQNPTVVYHDASRDDGLTDSDWEALGLWLKRHFAWDKRLEKWIVRAQ